MTYDRNEFDSRKVVSGRLVTVNEGVQILPGRVGFLAGQAPILKEVGPEVALPALFDLALAVALVWRGGCSPPESLPEIVLERLEAPRR